MLLDNPTALALLRDYREGTGRADTAAALLLADVAERTRSALIKLSPVAVHQHQVQDVQQDVAIVVAKLMAGHMAIDSWSSVMSTIANRRVLNWLRAMSRAQETLEEKEMTPSQADSPGKALIRAETYAELHKACDILPADEKFIIDKLFFAPTIWKQRDLAKHFEVGDSLMSHRVKGILAKLKDMLELVGVKGPTPWEA